MRWTRQRRRATGVCRAGHPVSDQPARGRTALQRLRQDFGRRHMAGRGLGGGCCGRRSRVVLASVADVKLAEAASSQPGFDGPLIRSATVTKKNSSPGRARRKPLKPLRGESRVISGVLVVTTVCLLPMHTGCGAPGTRLSLRPHPFEGSDFAKPRTVRAARSRAHALLGFDAFSSRCRRLRNGLSVPIFRGHAF
jgi:hypothetical protein